MAKKHWIYIKRGLSEDPKHRAAMGECVWLYMHIIDRADWETGIAFEWKDKQEAADMGMNVDTLRAQRRKLEELDYICCKQKQHDQDISIMEWKNPRDYGAETKNPRNEGEVEATPSTFEGGIQGSSQDGSEGSSQVPRRVKTPSLPSKSKSSSSSKKAEPSPLKANQIPEVILFREVTKRYPNAANFDDVVSSVKKVSTRIGRDVTKDDLLTFYKAWTAKGYNPSAITWLEWAEAGQVPVNGTWKSNRQPPAEPKAFDGIRKFLARHGEQNG